MVSIKSAVKRAGSDFPFVFIPSSYASFYCSFHVLKRTYKMNRTRFDFWESVDGLQDQRENLFDSPPPRHDTNRLSTNRTIMEFGSRTSVSPVISSHPFPSHPGQKPVCRTWPVPPRRGLVSPPPHHSLPSVTRLWPLTLKLKAQPAHTQCEQSDSLYHGSFHWLFTTSWFIHLLVPSVGRQRVRQSRW